MKIFDYFAIVFGWMCITAIIEGIRHALSTSPKELANKVADLEAKVSRHDVDYNTLKSLVSEIVLDTHKQIEQSINLQNYFITKDRSVFTNEDIEKINNKFIDKCNSLQRYRLELQMLDSRESERISAVNALSQKLGNATTLSRMCKIKNILRQEDIGFDDGITYLRSRLDKRTNKETDDDDLGEENCE